MFSGFATRFTARMTALVLVASMLTGCAEINRRGGVIADVEDYVLFVAHTKSHRLFRSYMLIGVLLAAARQGSHNEIDKSAIAGNLQSALAIAYESYACLYTNSKNEKWIEAAVTKIGSYEATSFPEPAVCQFFDEKMARLDYALYRLALSSLFNERSNAQLASIRDKLIGELPVISASAKAAIFANKAVSQATTIVDDLLNLSFSSAGPVLTLLPLYRDALEMNMWVITDNLTKICGDVEGSAEAMPINYRPVETGYPMDCTTKAYAKSILSNGNGNLALWRDFVWRMNYSVGSIEAYQPHFLLVSRLIWRSCENLLANCSNVMTSSFELAAKQSLIVNWNTKQLKRTYSAEVPTSSRLARQPVLSPLIGTSSPKDVVPQGREPDATGALGEPKKQ
ncbi:hypothetical protein [Tardiphaga sp. 709]|uniref:hypothetical protein n=1 Tax=Tardiphaga sp. 709 TaxID=3076039 RepID=UPI0028F168D0|nr:hypothetical protein [Tardiphaga sp. 709]WNV08504.1 hypothetical protein RSO67_23905 [Tardiphaga sp. 709]